MLGSDFFPVSENKEMAEIAGSTEKAAADSAGAASAAVAKTKPAHGVKPQAGRRENTLQKINHLDVKGRIQLALKGNKEERSILIRMERGGGAGRARGAKLSDGEVEKFALQKNVLEAVLRQIAEAAVHEELHRGAESGGEPADANSSGPRVDETSAGGGFKKIFRRTRKFPKQCGSWR